jgi:hypothetical protein
MGDCTEPLVAMLPDAHCRCSFSKVLSKNLQEKVGTFSGFTVFAATISGFSKNQIAFNPDGRRLTSNYTLKTYRRLEKSARAYLTEFDCVLH